jgi:hypothetical protein
VHAGNYVEALAALEHWPVRTILDEHRQPVGRLSPETGQVANRPIYAAIGVSLEGDKDILGLWAGSGGEGAKFWMAVLTDLKNRGVRDTFFVVCDGLKGLPEVVANVWPQATVQTCIIHLIRNTFRLASKRFWDELKKDLRPVYTAVNAEAALTAFEELQSLVGGPLPGHHQVVGQRLAGVHPVLGLRRRDPQGDLLDECHRESQRPLPSGGAGPRTFPDRAGGTEMSLPGDEIP